MHRLDTQLLSGFNETPVDPPDKFDVQLANGNTLTYAHMLAHTPAVTTEYDGFSNPQTVLSDNDVLPPWDEEQHYPVGRLASFHGRNLGVLAAQAWLRDRYGNDYYSLCIKGSDLSDPHIMKSVTAERDYIVHGLQESLVMERILRASQLLRANRIGTEYICGLGLPKTYPVTAENGIDYELKSLPQLLNTLAGEYAHTESEANGGNPLQIKADMMERFQDCDYLVTYRAMDCPFRFGELGNSRTFYELKQIVRDATDDPEWQEYIDDLSLVDYLYEQAVPTMAATIADVHRLDLVSGFPHGNNFTAFGSLVDLDSVRGEPLGLGDKPTTIQDEVNDVRQCLNSIISLCNRLQFEDANDEQTTLHRQQLQYYLSLQFMRTYLTKRFASDDQQVEFIAEYLFAIAQQDEGEHGLNMINQVKFACGLLDTLNLTGQPNPEPLNAAETLAQTKHTSTFLRGMPVDLLERKRVNLLDENWHADHQIEGVSDRRLRHLLQGIFQNTALLTLAQHYAKSDSPQRHAEFVFMLHATIGTSHFADRQPRNPEAHKAKLDFDAFQAALLDGICQSGISELQPQIKQLLLDDLEALSNQVSYVDICPETDTPASILYLKNDQQYAAIFNKLGVDEATKITKLGSLYSLLIEDRFGENAEDVLLIADYARVAWTSERISREDIIKSTIGYWKNTRPLVLVRGLTTGKLEVFVSSHPTLPPFSPGEDDVPAFDEEDESEDHEIDYEEFLATICADTAPKPAGRLF